MAIALIFFLARYLINKFYLPGWYSWVTSEDGTPAPGRRITLSFDPQSNFKKLVKKFVIYDVQPADKRFGGVIYAQCEQVDEGSAVFRIIKCKGYFAPLHDKAKLIAQRGEVIGTVVDETEPAEKPEETE